MPLNLNYLQANDLGQAIEPVPKGSNRANEASKSLIATRPEQQHIYRDDQHNQH